MPEDRIAGFYKVFYCFNMHLKLFSLFFIMIFPFTTWSAPKNFSLKKSQQISEDDVTFKYISSDGEIELKCTHYYDQPELYDWDVWCGKGTNMLRQFRVHFLVRQYEHQTEDRSALEVLYWVIDRDQNISKAFSSTTTWVQFKNKSKLETLSFSQGIENDYAYLKVDLRP